MKPPASGAMHNVLAGLTLAAITIPEQMATAKLGGFDPHIGFYAFVGATVGFAIAGASRIMTVGADTTITPIFAGLLAAMATAGTSALPASAVALALIVAAFLAVAGLLRLGWIADLLSTPIVVGFLAGIAVHIAVSQLPDALGLSPPSGELPVRLYMLWPQLKATNPWSILIAAGVLAFMLLAERWNPRIPGALIAVGAATICTILFGLDQRGVGVLGHLPAGLPTLVAPAFSGESLRQLVPLALLISLVVMMQTAAVDRSFEGPSKEGSDINRDFIGLSAANLGAALLGAFPVNASPPRTAVVHQAGATSQLAALVAAAVVAVLVLAGLGLLTRVPHAALAGVLLFVAMRILRVREIVAIARSARVEFALIVLTAAAVILLPVPTGMAIGIGLSLLHGSWITAQTRVSELRRVPGTTIWWPSSMPEARERRAGALVLGFAAPLLFANAQAFRRGVMAAIAADEPITVLVLEANGIADIDYTAAQVLKAVIDDCRARNIDFAIARLESARAQRSLERLEVLARLGPERLFLSVAQALAAMLPGEH
jgi:MFS superfamily sulfate permease-like transporter